MYLILALLLQATPAATPAQEQRAVVVKGLEQFEANITKFAGFIHARFPSDTNRPRTGLTVMSDDADAEHLHPIIVTQIVKDGPAAVAGVLPGDRIIRVGQRRIEHETAQVFGLITEGVAGPLQLGMLRNGTELSVTVDRQPLACVRRSSERINQQKWDERITELRRIAGMVRSELDNEAITPPQERYRIAKDHLVQIYGLLADYSKMLSSELNEALANECTFLTQ